MLKKVITYTDYDGEQRTETHWFNLTKAEILEMELLTAGGMEKMIQNIIEAKDVPSLVGLFKKLIDKSYGVKSPDGKRFIKNPEALQEFKETEAYSELFMELATDSDAAAKFVEGIIPADIDINDPAVKAKAEKLIEAAGGSVENA